MPFGVATHKLMSIGLKSVSLELFATQQEYAYLRTFVEQNVSKGNGELARIAPNVIEAFLSSISIVD